MERKHKILESKLLIRSKDGKHLDIILCTEGQCLNKTLSEICGFDPKPDCNRKEISKLNLILLLERLDEIKRAIKLDGSQTIERIDEIITSHGAISFVVKRKLPGIRNGESILYQSCYVNA